jgi:hypothetical protein
MTSTNVETPALAGALVVWRRWLRCGIEPRSGSNRENGCAVLHITGRIVTLRGKGFPRDGQPRLSGVLRWRQVEA